MDIVLKNTSDKNMNLFKLRQPFCISKINKELTESQSFNKKY